MNTVGAAVLALQSPAAIPGGPMTIDQAVTIAEHNAFAVKLQESNVVKSKAQVALAAGQFGPQAGFSFIYTKYGTEVSVVLSPGTPPVIISPLDSRVGTFSVNLPIDISAILQKQLKAAKAGFHASEQNLRASLNDARLNARQSYLNVLRAIATIAVSQEAVKDATTQLDLGEKLFAGQQIAKVDVIRYESQLAQAKSDLLVAQNALQIAKYVLNDALALPIETPVEVVDLTVLPNLPSDQEALVRAGETQRPEVQSILQTIRSLGYTRQAAQAGLDPSLSVGLSYQRNIDPAGFTSVDATTAGTVTLNVPVFDSGITRARVRSARQDEVQAEINLKQTQLGISQEVRNAIANLGSARDRLANADQQVALAREVFRLANIREQAAEGTYVDVIDAENSLTQALNTQVGARYDYLLAYSQLQRAIGTDNIPGAAPAAAMASRLNATGGN